MLSLLKPEGGLHYLRELGLPRDNIMRGIKKKWDFSGQHGIIASKFR